MSPTKFAKIPINAISTKRQRQPAKVFRKSEAKVTTLTIQLAPASQLCPGPQGLFQGRSLNSKSIEDPGKIGGDRRETKDRLVVPHAPKGPEGTYHDRAPSVPDTINRIEGPAPILHYSHTKSLELEIDRHVDTHIMMYAHSTGNNRFPDNFTHLVQIAQNCRDNGSGHHWVSTMEDGSGCSTGPSPRCVWAL